MKTSLQLGVLIAKIAALAPALVGKVLSVIPDGVSADEAEALAVEALGGEDIRVMIRGVDVLDDETQAHLVAFVARAVRNVIDAATGPKA
jgi:hypothetical protein